MPRSAVLDRFLAASHLIVPDELPGLVADHSRQAGARHAVVYLVDLDQRWLVPLSSAADDDLPPAAVDAVDDSPAGESYREVRVVVRDDVGTRSVFVPMIDGTERLGVIRFDSDAADHEPDLDLLRGISALTAELVMSKRAYGDYFEIARRRAPVSVTAELLWQLLPPLTFATAELVIAGFFVPTDDIGGDAFDYGVDHERAHLALFDAMGHGLNAGLMATIAVAAYRNSRRERMDLDATARHVSGTVTAQFGESSYVTGVLAVLDHRSGHLAWRSAGHPPPLVLRRGHEPELQQVGGQPFGVGPVSAVIETHLEPGDRLLLYSDGITEARDPDGIPLGVDRLAALVTEHAEVALAPEAVRRVMHAVQASCRPPMRDDATLVMLEWRGIDGRRLTL
jgi:serine phosphatase RsbU (regulator of sigma subunit)